MSPWQPLSLVNPLPVLGMRGTRQRCNPSALLAKRFKMSTNLHSVLNTNLWSRPLNGLCANATKKKRSIQISFAGFNHPSNLAYKCFVLINWFRMLINPKSTIYNCTALVRIIVLSGRMCKLEFNFTFPKLLSQHMSINKQNLKGKSKHNATQQSDHGTHPPRWSHWPGLHAGPFVIPISLIYPEKLKVHSRCQIVFQFIEKKYFTWCYIWTIYSK